MEDGLVGLPDATEQQQKAKYIQNEIRQIRERQLEQSLSAQDQGYNELESKIASVQQTLERKMQEIQTQHQRAFDGERARLHNEYESKAAALGLQLKRDLLALEQKQQSEVAARLEPLRAESEFAANTLKQVRAERQRTITQAALAVHLTSDNIQYLLDEHPSLKPKITALHQKLAPAHCSATTTATASMTAASTPAPTFSVSAALLQPMQEFKNVAPTASRNSTPSRQALIPAAPASAASAATAATAPTAATAGTSSRRSQGHAAPQQQPQNQHLHHAPKYPLVYPLVAPEQFGIDPSRHPQEAADFQDFMFEENQLDDRSDLTIEQDAFEEPGANIAAPFISEEAEQQIQVQSRPRKTMRVARRR